MAFNTFLGYIPIEISFHLPKLADRRSLLFWIMSLMWLLFYPNAPYVLTDLFHLSWLHPHTNISGILKSSPTMWLIFSIMIISAFVCVLVGSLELLNTSSLIAQVLTPRFPQLRYFLMVVFTFCSSIGIYIGRFLRLHSVYMLITPSWFFRQIWAAIFWQSFEFVLILTVLQLIICWFVHLLLVLRN
ncbi:DUF1361 domain-containing protein [Limosilactobacillus coleohominis]|nr:DUF1361 domain-containing protein [Limosilactobacillus coleohominis]